MVKPLNVRIKYPKITYPRLDRSLSSPWQNSEDRSRKTQSVTKKQVQDKAKGRCKDCKEYIGTVGQVHHKDGDRTNDRASNLVFLCPTCHAKRHRKIQEKKAQKKAKSRKKRSNPYSAIFGY